MCTCVSACVCECVPGSVCVFMSVYVRTKCMAFAFAPFSPAVCLGGEWRKGRKEGKKGQRRKRKKGGTESGKKGRMKEIVIEGSILVNSRLRLQFSLFLQCL